MTSVTAISSDRRIFFLGVNTGYVTKGLPDDRLVEFYRQRASPRLHCAIVGNVVVPGGHPSNASTPGITEGSIWGRVAEAIAERGSVPGIQLATAWPGYVGTRNFVGARPQHVMAAARQLVTGFSSARIMAVLDAFEEAARIAIDHGFRHVQLHGAHGYLLNLLIDGRINPSASFVLDRLGAFGDRLSSQSIESSIRISMRTGDAEFDAEGTSVFQDKIASLPFDYVDLSSGFYNIDKRLIYPSRSDTLRDRISESRMVATRLPHRAFILSGRAIKTIDETLPSNLHIGICRDLIANPNYLGDLQNGCQNRNKCHYFSRRRSHLTCGLWDSVRS